MGTTLDAFTNFFSFAGSGSISSDTAAQTMEADEPEALLARPDEEEEAPVARRDGTAARARLTNNPRARLLRAQLQAESDPANSPWAQDTDWSKASSSEIQDLQTKLKAAGHDPGKLDGAWGPNTAKATQAARAQTPSALLDRTDWDTASSADVRTLQQERC